MVSIEIPQLPLQSGPHSAVGPTAHCDVYIEGLFALDGMPFMFEQAFRNIDDVLRKEATGPQGQGVTN